VTALYVYAPCVDAEQCMNLIPTAWCSYFKSVGYCHPPSVYATYMEQNCPLTCG